MTAESLAVCQEVPDYGQTAAFADYLQGHWLDWLRGAGAGVVTWIVIQWGAAPLQTFLVDRRHAIEVIQQYGEFESFFASEETVKAARAAIGKAARQMLFYAQGGPAIVRLYCWVRRYDLSLAGRILNGLSEQTSSGRTPPAYQADAARVYLGAARLIPGDRRRAIRLALRAQLEDQDTDRTS